MAVEGFWGSCKTHRVTFFLAFILLSSLSHLTPLKCPSSEKTAFAGLKMGDGGFSLSLCNKWHHVPHLPSFLLAVLTTSCCRQWRRRTLSSCLVDKAEKCTVVQDWSHNRRSIRKVMQKKKKSFSSAACFCNQLYWDIALGSNRILQQTWGEV